MVIISAEIRQESLALRDSMILQKNAKPSISSAVFLENGSTDHPGLDGESWKWSPRYLRELTSGEVGCAVAHNNARCMVSAFANGAIILEDDAVLLDPQKMIADARNFLKVMEGERAVLSFFTGEESQVSRFFKKRRFVRRLQSPPFAVAYALTPQAAKELVSSNTPVRYVADWPPSRVKFFQSTSNYVQHGEFPSLIDPEMSEYRMKSNKLLGFLVATFLYYPLHRKQYSNFLEFYKFTWRPRALFHLDAFFRHLVGIK